MPCQESAAVGSMIYAGLLASESSLINWQGLTDRSFLSALHQVSLQYGTIKIREVKGTVQSADCLPVCLAVPK